MTKILTPVLTRRLEASSEILENPAEEIAYQHTVFCQTCLPYKNPDSIRAWERQQGAVFLRIEAGTIRNPKLKQYIEVGLPYGTRPRLILAHLNRQAIITGCPKIEVEASLTAFIKRVTNNNSPNSRDILRFKDQLTRFAASTVRMAVDLPEDRAYQVQTHIISTMELWLTKDDRQRVLWPAVVRLSQEYFESLRNHAVPLDERAIAALANSPMALDVYAWLAQRLCRVTKPQFIRWVSLKDQFGFGYSRMDNFKAGFRAVLRDVCDQYPQAKVDLDDRGMSLQTSSPPVPGRLLIV